MATAKQFLKALKEETATPKTREEFWREQLEAWVGDLNSLIESMTTWVKPLVDDGQAWLDKRTLHIEEPDLGGYEAPTLRIALSNTREVSLRPRGLRIVGVVQTNRGRSLGAQGRADLECGVQREVLLRFKDKNGVTSWRSFAGGEEKELTEEVFFSLLARVTSVRLG